jgi:hypothetical protein
MIKGIIRTLIAGEDVKDAAASPRDALRQKMPCVEAIPIRATLLAAPAQEAGG